jgi:methionyl-tRNA synthetase
MSPASFVRFSGYELGIQQSNHDFEERLLFCRAYAFRKGIRDAVKELGTELSTEERQLLEKKVSLTWEDVRREMDSVSVTSAYSEGKAQAERALRLVQKQTPWQSPRF